MKKAMVFNSFSDYEAWTDKFNDANEYEMIPSLIDDGWKISADLFVECKRWKTAVRHFFNAFENIRPEVAEWKDCILESCENGCFVETTGWKPSWVTSPEEVIEFAKGGTYSFGVEETSEGLWYVYLNISGVYAGRDAA